MMTRLFLGVLLVCGVTATVEAGAENGRWKGDGNGGCYWDANDVGPDQCDPNAPAGRWKVGSDRACYWAAGDNGPNQCVPGSVNNVPEDEAYRLAAASMEFQAQGVVPWAVTPRSLPIILRALERQGFRFEANADEAAYAVEGVDQMASRFRRPSMGLVTVQLGGPGNGGAGRRMSCGERDMKADALERMSRAFAMVTWLYGAGGGMLRVLVVDPPILAAVTVGAAVAGIASQTAGWLARDYRNAECVASGGAPWIPSRNLVATAWPLDSSRRSSWSRI